eukprot:2030260-Karenia_brevis.AAC.1
MRETNQFCPRIKLLKGVMGFVIIISGIRGNVFFVNQRGTAGSRGFPGNASLSDIALGLPFTRIKL